MSLKCILLLISSLLGCVLTQAPGDGDAVCVEAFFDDGQPNPFGDHLSYPANVWPLMDSKHYRSLLLGSTAVWQQVDNDDNNSPEIATNV